MNVLIVHAHHEPQSFCSALFSQAVATFQALGHDVAVSDLYRDGFNPVSDRGNFVSVHDEAYLKQQLEEQKATDVGGFAPELEKEIVKLERCDLLVFSFPLWWFGLPAILKGWVDRVFAMRRIYGEGKLYENGLGQARKRGMVLMTTGGGLDAYSGYGVNPSLEAVLSPIHHGIFWFNGFLPLDPFVAWSPVRIPAQDRSVYLHSLDQRLRGLDQETPIQLPRLSDFPGFGKDSKKRFLVNLTRATAAEPWTQILSDIARLKRSGALLQSHIGAEDAQPWQGSLVFRALDLAEVQSQLAGLPWAASLHWEICELMPS